MTSAPHLKMLEVTSFARRAGGGPLGSSLRRGLARRTIGWVIAFALLFQLAALAVSPVAPAGSLNSLIASDICHTADDGAAPSDDQDRVAAHFKCIACVLACSSLPPFDSAVVAARIAWAGYRPAWPLSAALAEGASLSSHFARGPPAAA